MVTRLYLDKRAARADGSYPVKLSLAHHGKTALISLDVFLGADDWDAKRQAVVRVPNKAAINSYLLKRKLEIDDAIRELQVSGALRDLSITDIRQAVIDYLEPKVTRPVLFLEYYDAFTQRHENKRTREIYQATRKQILNYSERAHKLRFEDITKSWLDSFFASMSKTSPSVNARNIHLRNIRAVFNDALDQDITSFYPFRKYKIKPVQTAKRALDVEKLRALFQAGADWQKKYVDVFMLSFMLIGCNIIDLCRAHQGQIVSGRFTYTRAKTKRFYSIRIEPEAQVIIDRLTDGDVLLACAKGCEDYRSFAERLNSNLRALCPGVTTYWARHSWATIASSLKISKETIAKALGHGGASVTDVYIDYDLERVDRANRLVLDFVLYNKTPDEKNIP